MNETIVKHLNFGIDARDKVFEGIEKLTKAVSSTLGASGKCVILEDQHGNPQITKDGVTVANSIILLDPVENMGSKLLKEAARNTVKEAGDGTTTATVLAYAILCEAYKYIEKETPRNLKLGINKAVENVIKYLETNSSKVKGKKIEQVATISANNDNELGQIIGEAFKQVDETGLVMMETNDEPLTYVESIEGVQYERGLKNDHFITNKGKGTAELINPLVLIVETPIENIRKIQSVLEHVIKNKRSLLIIGDTDPQVVNALAMNKVNGHIKVNVVDAPVYGISKRDTLDDLALLTKATIINEDLGDDMDLITEEHLGSCAKAVSTTIETIIQRDAIVVPGATVSPSDIEKSSRVRSFRQCFRISVPAKTHASSAIILPLPTSSGGMNDLVFRSPKGPPSLKKRSSFDRTHSPSSESIRSNLIHFEGETVFFTDTSAGLRPPEG